MKQEEILSLMAKVTILGFGVLIGISIGGHTTHKYTDESIKVWKDTAFMLKKGFMDSLDNNEKLIKIIEQLKKDEA